MLANLNISSAIAEKLSGAFYKNTPRHVFKNNA
jgi:hypothetical protein